MLSCVNTHMRTTCESSNSCIDSPPLTYIFLFEIAPICKTSDASGGKKVGGGKNRRGAVLLPPILLSFRNKNKTVVLSNLLTLSKGLPQALDRSVLKPPLQSGSVKTQQSLVHSTEVMQCRQARLNALCEPDFYIFSYLVTLCQPLLTTPPKRKIWRLKTVQLRG